MNALNKLLDKAKETRSIPSDMALAAKLGRSRALVSEWRKGAKQVQDAEIAQLAEMAHEDPAAWLVAIHAEQATGAAGRAWAKLARQLGAAAAVAAVALLFVPQANAAAGASLTDAGYRHYAKCQVGGTDRAAGVLRRNFRSAGDRTFRF